MSTVRSSNIELLRILTMFAIVLFHYASPLGAPNYVYDGSKLVLFLSRFISDLIGSGGKIGVQIFVIISGYFLCTMKFNKLRLFKLIFQSYFWNLAVLAFVLYGLGMTVEKSDLHHALFPLTPLNWFIRSYLLLYIVFPLLNKYIVHKLSVKHFGWLTAAGIVLCFVIPSVLDRSFEGYFNMFILFTELYFIGAYIRLYETARLKKYIYGLFALGAFITVAFIAIMSYNATYGPIINLHVSSSQIYNKEEALFALPIACGTFLWFKNLHLPYSKLINTIATTTLAVYLIHANGLLIHYFYLPFGATKLGPTPYLVPLNMIVTSVCVFAICTILELLRQRFVEKPILKLLEKRAGQ